MLPGQQITPDWLLTVFRRRWWLLVAPLVVGAIGAGVYAHFDPNRYKSETRVLVVPPQLPASYVRPTVTQPLSQRLRTLSLEVLSRPRLERIILDFDLYREEREHGIMEDVVERMRNRDIGVSLPARASRESGGASFTLAYTASDARVAHRVTERLTSLFIDENARLRETIAEGTDQFITGELDAARMRLEETERKLETYKRQFGGELPQQMQSNLAALHGLQLQVQSLGESINRDRTEQIAIDRQISDLSGGDTSDGPVDLSMPVATPYDDAVVKARATLDALLLRLTTDHPDVTRQQRVLGELEERARAAQLQRPVSPNTPVAGPGRERRNLLDDLRRRRTQLDQQIAGKQGQINAKQGQAVTYQSRVDAAPTREAELIGVTRDYETLKNRYNLLLAQGEQAKVAANMERRQISEQFRIIDPPRVPERPISPDRPRMTMLGAMAGLAFGVLLIGVLEYRDRSFRSEADVLATLALPVVAVVPTLLTSAERRRRWKRRWALSATGVATVVGGTVALFWKYGL